MATDRTRVAFDAAVDELNRSSLRVVDPTPAQWRRILRENTETEVFRHRIAPVSGRFDASRSPSGAWDQDHIAAHLRELGGAVLGQWERTHDRRALRIAVALWRDVVARAWLTDIATPIGDLADRFLERYQETAALPLLDMAVRLGQDAVFDPLAFQQSRPRRLLVLADALRCRYEYTGDRAALVESMARYREASSGATTGPKALAGIIAMQAHQDMLTGRSGAPRPVELRTDHGPLARAAALTELSAVWLDGFRYTGDSPRLDEAIGALRSALELTPADHRDRPLRMARLGAALRQAFLRHPQVPVLEESVALCRAALALPIDRPGVRAEAMTGLALALRDRHGAEGGTPEHLAEAGLLATELAHAYPPGHPERAAVLDELADLSPDPVRLAPSHEDPGRAGRLLDLAASLPPSDAHRAVAAYAEVARTPGAPLRVRGLASQRWGRSAAEQGDFAGAEQAFRLTVDLLPDLVSPLEQRDDQEYQLMPFGGLASDAAACLLNRGADPAEALDLLERGRCVLFSHALGEVPERVDEVVRSQVAAAGPVVVVNVSRFGSHAIALTAAGTEVIALPGLTPDAVEDRRIALDLAQDLMRSPTVEPDLRWAANRSVTRLLGWLWDTVTGPVLETLGLEPAPDPLPRLWWLPTGQLSLLPVHAAGHHTARDGRTVFDRVVGSCTPTLHQLLRARLRGAHRPPDRSLVVAIGDLPDYRLPAAGREAEVAGARLPGARMLLDGAADPDSVREELAMAAWVHIACHATTDVGEPSASRLALAGGALSVVDIGRLRIRDAHFAYLSACGTARGGDVLSDEVIHISSAFQLAGYSHVIGTLWPIVDDVAARIADDVYAELSGGADPARRLHAAVRGVRDEYAGNSPLLWASHQHIGP
ncbi:CHAT domain-containing protein [Streptomyces sp. NPDC088178]|uniref:CHAT domain-containing protein n=1 Tax=Streptomyces sp. NPDC088178 TaxID=3365836 RepID=UPI00381A35E9